MNRSRNLYQDRNLVLDEDGITITSYRFPGDRRHIPYASIREHTLVRIGPLSGQHRLVGIGFRRPRHFFHWDRSRSTKTRSVAVNVGRLIRLVLSPDDPERFSDILDRRTGPDDEPAEAESSSTDRPTSSDDLSLSVTDGPAPRTAQATQCP
ncbi:MAG: hypothetical protein ACR2QK_02775 [Acidimicrobiales bacterium]